MSGLLVFVLALRFPFLVFAIYLAGLLKDPAMSVGMVGRFVWGAMYLAWTIKYAVQARWSSAVPFIGLLSLAGFGAAESGMNCGVIGVIAIASSFVSVALELAGAAFGLGGACLVGCVYTVSQPTVVSHTKAGHECREGYHRLRLLLAEVPGEPLVTDVMLECH